MGAFLLLIGAVEIATEAGHAVVPETLVLTHPLICDGELLRTQRVAVGPSLAPALNQPGIEEDAQMLRDRRARHLVGAGQLVDGLLPRGERIEQGAAHRVREGDEDLVDGKSIYR